MDGPDPREAFESSVRGLTNPRAGFAAETLTLLRLATWLGQATAAERGITPDPPAHWGSLIGALLLSEGPACRWLQAAAADTRLDATRFLPASRRYRRAALAAAQRGEAAPAPSGRWFSPSLTAQITAARDDARRVGSAGLPELRPVHLLAGAILAPVGDHARELAGALANLPALQAHLRVWVADEWAAFSDTALGRFGFGPSDTPTVWPWTKGPAPDVGRTQGAVSILSIAGTVAPAGEAIGAVLTALGSAAATNTGSMALSEGDAAVLRFVAEKLPDLRPQPSPATTAQPRPPGTSAGATLLERACRLAARVGQTPDARTLGLRHLLGAALATAEDLPPSFHALPPPSSATDPEQALQDLRLDFLALVAMHHKTEDGLDAWAEAVLGERITRTAPAGDQSPERDLLGFTRYARAFASVIADTAVTPPLAIGLFGAWGSGKSAMMKMIERELTHIEASAEVTGRTEFCRGIVTVEFNAWHYAEANLWASLFVRIMEVLDTHLSPATPPAIAEQYQALVRELDAKDAESMLAMAQAEAADRAAMSAEAEAKAAVTASETALGNARALATAQETARQDVAGRDVRREAMELLRDAGATLRALGLDARAQEIAVTAAGEDGRQVVARLAAFGTEIDAAQQQVTTLRAELARLWGVLRRSHRAQVVGAGILTLLGAALLLFATGAGPVAWLAPGGASVAAGLLLSLQVLAPHWKALRAALAKAPAIARQIADGAAALDARAKSREDSAKAARDGAIEAEARAAAAVEIRAAEDRAREAARLREEAERLKADAAAARDAAALLRARLEASEPSRLLADFVRDRAGSEEYGRALGLPTRIRRDITALREKLEALKTQPDAPHRADRIVLFIDDLDRCKPEVVVRVLEAVNILLTFELFVVVVGVDMAWLDRALAVHHAQLIEVGAATPQDYMEKIFQVPFWVPAMDAGGRASLLHAALPQAEPVAVDGGGNGGTAPVVPPEPTPPEPTEPKPTPPPPAPLPSLDPVRLGAEERTDLLRIGALAGETPRRLKRFARSYLILRASLAGQRQEDLAAGEYAIVARLVAAASAAPKLWSAFRTAILGAPEGTKAAALLDGLAQPGAEEEALALAALFPADPQGPEAGACRDWVEEVSRFSFAAPQRPRPIPLPVPLPPRASQPFAITGVTPSARESGEPG